MKQDRSLIIFLSVVALLVVGGLIAFIASSTTPSGKRDVKDSVDQIGVKEPVRAKITQQKGKFVSELFTMSYLPGTSQVKANSGVGQVTVDFVLPGGKKAGVNAVKDMPPDIAVGVIDKSRAKRVGNTFIVVQRSGSQLTVSRMRMGGRVTIQTYVTGPASAKQALLTTSQNLARAIKPASGR